MCFFSFFQATILVPLRPIKDSRIPCVRLLFFVMSMCFVNKTHLLAKHTSAIAKKKYCVFHRRGAEIAENRREISRTLRCSAGSASPR
ncbi:hypothetical protein D4R75_05185 [bacterium]|nr:MAG: hypothetical protein D4R75_05185 [bacterium]